jgi:hypothetical protein
MQQRVGLMLQTATIHAGARHLHAERGCVMATGAKRVGEWSLQIKFKNTETLSQLCRN